MNRFALIGVLLAGISTGPAGLAQAAQDSPATIGGGASAAPHSWTQEQLLTSSVHEAWIMSGRNEDQFFEMVKELAAVSAQKRGVALPETQEAGARAGAWIKKESKRDPDQLLYAVVDRAVVHVAGKGTSTQK